MRSVIIMQEAQALSAAQCPHTEPALLWAKTKIYRVANGAFTHHEIFDLLSRTPMALKKIMKPSDQSFKVKDHLGRERDF